MKEFSYAREQKKAKSDLILKCPTYILDLKKKKSLNIVFLAKYFCYFLTYLFCHRHDILLWSHVVTLLHSALE